MTGILEVLTQNIFPIFLVAGFGYLARRLLGLDVRTVSSVAFNVFGPCLVFDSLVNTELPVEQLGRLAAFSLITILLMGLVAFLVSRLLRLSRMTMVTLLLVVMFVNGGNYGLTLNQLRYGEEGLARAVVYFLVSTILLYTVGVFLASAGTLSWRSSLRRLSTVPAVYAVAAALAVYSLEIPLPGPLLRGIEVAAAGAIPTMLMVLGMQIAGLNGLTSLRLAGLASVLRLAGGPLVAVLIAGLLGLQGLSRATAVIEASMPTAVSTIVLATEFDVQPPVVTSAVILTTLLSPLTIALMIETLGL